jgi:hypothetical protein
MHIEFVLDHSPRRLIVDLIRRDKRSYHCHVRNPPPEHYLPAAQILHRVIAASKKLITFCRKLANLILLADLACQRPNATVSFAPSLTLGAWPARTNVKEVVMRKFLILALFSMFFAAMACTKSEETPAPEASAEASPAAGDMASPAASDAAPAASPAAS